LVEATNHGDIDAKLILAERYYRGDHVEKDYYKASKLIKEGLDDLFRLAEEGNTRAQWTLGQYFMDGYCLPKDLDEAEFWLEKSAKANDSYGQFLYGTFFMKGSSPDYTSALYWITKANEQKEYASYRILAHLYQQGLGTEQDLQKAFELYLIGATLGDEIAMKQVAYCYDFGKGVKVNHSESFKWFKKLADLGDADAQNEIGVMYYTGRGVTQDSNEAFKWCMKSAKSGCSSAEVNIGYYYFYGIVVEKDLTEAFKWFQKSAQHGCSEGCRALANCYYYGIGVPKDLAKSSYWQDQANVR